MAELGPGRVGFHLDRSEEILETPSLSRIPWAPSWVCGALYHAGALWTIVDLGRFLGVPGEGPLESIVLLRGGAARVGFGVRATELVEAPKQAVVTLELRRSEWIVDSLSNGVLDYHHIDLDAILAAILEAF